MPRLKPFNKHASILVARQEEAQTLRSFDGGDPKCLALVGSNGETIVHESKRTRGAGRRDTPQTDPWRAVDQTGREDPGLHVPRGEPAADDRPDETLETALKAPPASEPNVH